MARKPVLAATLACAISGSAAMPAAADAALRVSAKLTDRAGVQRVEVTVASSKALTARTRPRKVVVTTGRSTVRLDRSFTSPKRTVWRSAALRGTTAKRMRAMAGRRLTVKVSSRERTRSYRPQLARQAEPTPAPAPAPGPDPAPTSSPTQSPSPQPLFEKPSGDLQGEQAYAHIARYFENSRFTDCPGAGWPNCSVEHRYQHCEGGGRTGQFEYHRYTVSSGSDVNAYGTYQVTGAEAYADGSWAVMYRYSSPSGTDTSTYQWKVAADGTVTGTYQHDNGNTQNLGPLAWQQPAGCS